jgi:hypothetical protein
VFIPDYLPLLFDDIEFVEALPGQKFDVTVDMNHPGLSGNDGAGDILEVYSGLSSMNKTLNLDINCVHVVTFSESSVNSLTMIGSADADELIITETAAVLPTLPGTAAGGHTNSAFVASGLAPQNPAIHFDGGPGVAEDQFTLVLTTAQNVGIFQDTLQLPGVEPNSGVINVEGAFTLSYESLSPIDVQGAGGAVMIDASLLGRMTELLLSSPGDAFELRGDGGFETTSFRGFDDFLVEPPEHVVLQLAGDYNGNGLVEQQDLDLVLVFWGKDAVDVPATWIGPPASRTIDQEELDAVLVNWGNTATRRPPLMAAGARPAAGAADDHSVSRAAISAARHAAERRIPEESIGGPARSKFRDAVFAQQEDWLLRSALGRRAMGGVRK